MTVEPTEKQQQFIDQLLSKDSHDGDVVRFTADCGGGKTMAACLAANAVRTHWPDAHIIMLSTYRWLKDQYEHSFERNDRHIHWGSPDDLDRIRSIEAGLIVVDEAPLNPYAAALLDSRLRTLPMAWVATASLPLAKLKAAL